VDSLQAFRDSRQRRAQSPRDHRVPAQTAEIAAESPGDAFRALADGLVEEARRAEAARVRLELAERAQSTLEAQLAEERRRREEAEKAWERTQRELEELRGRLESERASQAHRARSPLRRARARNGYTISKSMAPLDSRARNLSSVRFVFLRLRSHVRQSERDRSVAYSHAQPSPSPSRLSGSPDGVGMGPSTSSQSMSSPPPPDGAGSWDGSVCRREPRCRLSSRSGFGSGVASGASYCSFAASDSQATPSPSPSRPLGSLGSAASAAWATPWLEKSEQSMSVAGGRGRS
jgi:hypothetical protein